MQTETLTSLVVEALEGLKGRDITTMDVSELTNVTDVMIVVSGTSSRHINALANAVTAPRRYCLRWYRVW